MGDAVWDDRAPHRTHPPEPHTPAEPLPLPGPMGRVYQVTDASDGDIRPRMYAYWANAFIRDSDGVAFVFCSGPRFFKVDLVTGRVDRLGQFINYQGETEGWYWSPNGKVYIPHGAQLHRVDPFDPADDEVVLDIAQLHPGCDLWQAHSSDDGRVHSATVRRIVSDGPYQKIGTIVQLPGRIEFFHAEGDLDESQVDRSGRFLCIQENHNNRIVDLEAGGEPRRISDADGALAHLDMGHGFMVGENNQIGACMQRYLPEPSEGRVLFPTWNQGYVSTRGGRCLHSGDTHLNLVALDGSGVTPIIAHGNTGTDYDDRVKANLDPTGRVACYMSNMHGRRDVFLLVL
jgi:hypothetical protein